MIKIAEWAFGGREETIRKVGSVFTSRAFFDFVAYPILMMLLAVAAMMAAYFLDLRLWSAAKDEFSRVFAISMVSAAIISIYSRLSSAAQQTVNQIRMRQSFARAKQGAKP